jgi:hypothetical protein
MLDQNKILDKNQLKEKLLSQIDGFDKFCMFSLDDDIYLFFGNLGSYIPYCIDNGKIPIIIQIFEVINVLLDEKRGVEFENMIIVQISEMLYDKKEYFEAGNMYLNNLGRVLLLSIKENFSPFV